MTEPSELALKHARRIVEKTHGKQHNFEDHVKHAAWVIDEAIQESRQPEIIGDIEPMPYDDER